MKKIFVIIILLFCFSSVSSDEPEETLEKILSSHPEIVSLEQAWKSKTADADHAGVYPDPKFGFAFRNYPYNRALNRDDTNPKTPTMTGMEYSVSQEIPFPGKLSLQSKVAKLSAEEFRHLANSTKNRFASEFILSTIGLRSLEKKYSYFQENLRLLDSLNSVYKPAYTSGSINLSRYLRAGISKSKLKESIEKIKSEDESLRESLKYYEISESKNNYRIINVDFYPFLKEKEKLIEEMNLESLEKGLEENPFYLLRNSSIERSKEEKKLGGLTHFPETEVFFSYMKRKNRNFDLDQGPLSYGIMDSTEYRGDLFSLGVNMRVPVWSFLKKGSLDDKLDANIKVAYSEKEKTKANFSAEIKKLFYKYKIIKKRIAVISDEIIPEINSSISVAEASYKSGKIEFGEVLAFKIELQETKAMLVDVELEKYQDILSILEMTNLIFQNGKK